MHHGEVRLVRAVEVRLGAVWSDAARRGYAGLSGHLRVRQGEAGRGGFRRVAERLGSQGEVEHVRALHGMARVGRHGTARSDKGRQGMA